MILVIFRLEPPSDPGIVEAFDVVEYIRPNLRGGAIPAAIYTLSLEHTEESLSRSIVITLADSARAVDQLMVFEQHLVFTAGESRAVVLMWDDGAALAERHQQAPGLRSTHRPANDTLAVDIDNDAQIQPSSGVPHVGGISHPLGVGFHGARILPMLAGLHTLTI